MCFLRMFPIYIKKVYVFVYICHNIKEKKYIYINIYIKKRKGKEKNEL